VQAERAVEALAKYLPLRVKAVRDGRPVQIDATELVPGDIAIIEEGDRIAADARLLAGSIEVGMSALTGEAVPALRSASILDVDVPVLSAHECSTLRVRRSRRRSRTAVPPGFGSSSSPVTTR
jgi:P-type E1-E2 ATPase